MFKKYIKISTLAVAFFAVSAGVNKKVTADVINIDPFDFGSHSLDEVRAGLRGGEQVFNLVNRDPVRFHIQVTEPGNGPNGRQQRRVAQQADNSTWSLSARITKPLAKYTPSPEDPVFGNETPRTRIANALVRLNPRSITPEHPDQLQFTPNHGDKIDVGTNADTTVAYLREPEAECTQGVDIRRRIQQDGAQLVLPQNAQISEEGEHKLQITWTSKCEYNEAPQLQPPPPVRRVPPPPPAPVGVPQDEYNVQFYYRICRRLDSQIKHPFELIFVDAKQPSPVVTRMLTQVRVPLYEYHDAHLHRMVNFNDVFDAKLAKYAEDNEVTTSAADLPKLLACLAESIRDDIGHLLTEARLAKQAESLARDAHNNADEMYYRAIVELNFSKACQRIVDLHARAGANGWPFADKMLNERCELLNGLPDLTEFAGYRFTLNERVRIRGSLVSHPHQYSLEKVKEIPPAAAGNAVDAERYRIAISRHIPAGTLSFAMGARGADPTVQISQIANEQLLLRNLCAGVAETTSTANVLKMIEHLNQIGFFAAYKLNLDNLTSKY